MYPNHLGEMVNPMRLYYSIFEEGRNMVKFAVTFINSEITSCWKCINGRLMCIFLHVDSFILQLRWDVA